jgi:hypothetical protein
MDDLLRGHVDSCSRMQESPCDDIHNSQHSGKNRLDMCIAALASPQRSGQSSQLSHSSTGLSGGTLSGKDDQGLDLADPVESMPHVHEEAVCRVDAAALIETPPQSTSSSLPGQKRPRTEVVTVVPIICGTACDFMMRCKACNWYPPTANHGGGWCMCKRSTEVFVPMARTNKRRREEGMAGGQVCAVAVHICRLSVMI